MSEALRGVRVLDLTRGPAGGLATMILADFGAEVLWIEQPGVVHPIDRQPATRMWQRGKHRIALDVHRDRDRFDALCGSADVLICSWRQASLERHGLTYEALRERHPHLVFCHLSGFGPDGPYANYPGYEHVVAARVGRMRGFAGLVDRPGPVFSALQVGIHASAQSAATGIMAALLARGDSGAGRLVETSVMQGLLPYEQGGMLGIQFRERFPDMFPGVAPPAEPGTVVEPPHLSLYYHPAQTSDGRWLQFGNLLPHLFDNFIRVTELFEVLADPDFDSVQMLLPPDKQEAFRRRMLERIQERSADEWMDDFIADGGVVATKYQTTQQALDDPDIVANGHCIEREEGGRQLGPVARLTETPAHPGPMMDGGDDRATAWIASPRPAPKRPSPDAAPLAGVKVVELATIIAAPLGASFLADMGAEVIKVEQIGGDPYRGLAMGIGSARVNAGKQSLSIDLKSDAGKAAVLEVLRDADVLIHNFRPGVPERLGIGYEDVAAVNPGIVYLQSNGYGPDGPGALRPSTHPVPGAAMGGVMFQLGERVPAEHQAMEDLVWMTRRMMHANEVNPDPNTGMVVATSAMLGLMARASTGKGQQIFVDMFGANAYANHDDFLDYADKPGRALPDEGLFGLGSTYRLYEAADLQWVFLALVTPREKDRFVEILATEGIAFDRATLDVDDASVRLAELFKSRDADSWEALLAPEGIGCVRADALMPAQFWLDDPQAQTMDLAIPVEHPAWGDYRRHGANVRFDGQARSLGAPPLGGQHNKSVLTAAGFDDTAIDRFEADGVIWHEADGS